MSVDELTTLEIARVRAERLLAYELRRVCLPAVIRYCPSLDTAERVAAIVDFTFNLGSGSLKISTLRRRLNAKQWSDACAELAKWNKGGGRVLTGLAKRRAAEAALLSSDRTFQFSYLPVKVERNCKR